MVIIGFWARQESLMFSVDSCERELLRSLDSNSVKSSSRMVISLDRSKRIVSKSTFSMTPIYPIFGKFLGSACRGVARGKTGRYVDPYKKPQRLGSKIYGVLWVFLARHRC